MLTCKKCMLHTYGNARTGLSTLELHELKPVGFHCSTQCVVVVKEITLIEIKAHAHRILPRKKE